MRETPELIRENTMRVTGASSVTRLIGEIVGPNWLRTYGIAAGMAALLAITGANATAELLLPARLLDRFTDLDLWRTIIAMMAIITPMITVFVWLVTAGVNGRPPQIRNLPVYIPPVLVIALAMAILHVMVRREPEQSHAFTADIPTEPGALFRERLPFKFRHAGIHALEAEDHYLRVHTSAGDTLILMRLYDAIRELDGIEGSQTHRSWWVAKAAVTDVRRADGRIVLLLTGDLEAPVSRSFSKALKQDGWL